MTSKERAKLKVLSGWINAASNVSIDVTPTTTLARGALLASLLNAREILEEMLTKENKNV